MQVEKTKETPEKCCRLWYRHNEKFPAAWKTSAVHVWVDLSDFFGSTHVCSGRKTQEVKSQKWLSIVCWCTPRLLVLGFCSWCDEPPFFIFLTCVDAEKQNKMHSCSHVHEDVEVTVLSIILQSAQVMVLLKTLCDVLQRWLAPLLLLPKKMITTIVLA